jgi:hypothetical protein
VWRLWENRGYGTDGCGCRRRRGSRRVSSDVAARHSDRNAGRDGRDAEIAIDLADGKACRTGNRGRALALLGHLLDLGKLGKLHGVSRVLGVSCGKLSGPLLRG